MRALTSLGQASSHRRWLPIVTYHALDTSGSAISVTPLAFAGHLERFFRAGYRLLPLSAALDWLAHPDEGGPVAALTFDDGYRSVYEVARPLLERFGWAATVFAISDWLGGTNQWPGQPPTIPAARLMSATELRELSASGWEIGAHSRNHPDLTSLSLTELVDEVTLPATVLADVTGHPVRVFAYPYGRYNQPVRAAVAEIYTAACTTTMDGVVATSDRHTLARLDAWYFGHGPSGWLLTSPLLPLFARLVRHWRARHDKSRSGSTTAVATVRSTY